MWKSGEDQESRIGLASEERQFAPADQASAAEGASQGRVTVALNRWSGPLQRRHTQSQSAHAIQRSHRNHDHHSRRQ